MVLQDFKKFKDLGDAARKIACHKLNDQSSRSHTIFTIKIRLTTRSMLTGQTSNICGKINLVDLAVHEAQPNWSKQTVTDILLPQGSERLSKTWAGDQEMVKEAGFINRSLGALGAVISKLANRQKEHIPFRDSKLTRLLQARPPRSQ